MHGLLEHPNPEQFEAFLGGRMSADEEVLFASHVEVCAECTQRLDSFDEESFCELLRSAFKNSPDSPDEQFLSRRYATNSVSGVVPDLLSENAVQVRSSAQSRIPPSLDELPAALRDHARYHVLRGLGRGGMGTVYEAEHRVMHRRVAIKVINPELLSSQSVVDRFRAEVRVAARLTHPNIVTTHDADIADGLPFMVMEFIEGTNLAELLRERGPIPWREASHWMLDAARGLQHAFEQGMVHRDLKPHNLLLAANGHVKIFDFGLARFFSEIQVANSPHVPVPAPLDLDSDTTNSNTPSNAEVATPAILSPGASFATQTGALIGSPDYMSPEQIFAPRSADIRSDIYSLGCTFYELLTGNRPFRRNSLGMQLLAQVGDIPTPARQLASDLAPELDDILLRMLAKEPEQRYQTPADFSAALTLLLQPTAPLPLVAKEPNSPDRRRWHPLVLVLGGLLFFSAAILIWIETDFGSLVVEAPGKSARLIIRQNGEVRHAIDTAKNGSWSLRSGEYEIELAPLDREQRQLSQEHFRVTRGKRLTIIVTDKLAVTKLPGKTRVIGDWRFARDALGRNITRDRMVLSFEGPAGLADDSGSNEQGATLEHPRFQSYDIAAGMPYAGLDGRALHTGRASGGLWFPASQPALRSTSSFAVYARVLWRGKRASEQQTIACRPGCWELFLDPMGRLEFTMSSTKEQLIRCFERTPKTRQISLHTCLNRWVDIAFAFDGDSQDQEPDRVRVFVDGIPIAEFQGVAQFAPIPPLHLGCREGCQSLFEGLFDRVVVWNGIPDDKEFPALSKVDVLTVSESVSGEQAIWSPDDRWLAIGNRDGRARILNAETSQIVHELAGHQSIIHRLHFRHDGERLVTSSEDGTARIWDVATGECLHVLPDHSQSVFSAMFSPDGRQIATASADCSVRVWNAESGETMHIIRHPNRWVWDAVFSPDGNWLATCSGNADTILWKIPGFKQSGGLFAHSAWIRRVAFTPDGQRVVTASGDNTFKVWDLHQQKELITIPAHAEVVQSVAVSPDGRFIATGSFDREVKLWDAHTYQNIPLGWRMPGSCYHVHFSSDSQRLLTSGQFDIIRIWTLPKLNVAAK